jgi:hypothetical protein
MRYAGTAAALLVLAILMGLARPALARDIDRSFRELFPASPGTILHLEHGDGDVTVVGWERDEIEVSVVYRGSARKFGVGSATDDFSLECRSEGSEVWVDGKEAGSGVILGYVTSDVSEYVYRVRAPSYVDLDLDGGDGDVIVESWRGNVDYRLHDGNLTLRDVVCGTIRVEIEDGAVAATGVEADLGVVSRGGRVDVLESRSPGLDVKSDRGEVRIDVRAVSAPRVQVESGDKVHVDLGRGSSTAFDLGTETGRIRLDLPEGADIAEEPNRVTGRLGDGEGSVTVRTGEGSIVLRESGETRVF